MASKRKLKVSPAFSDEFAAGVYLLLDLDQREAAARANAAEANVAEANEDPGHEHRKRWLAAGQEAVRAVRRHLKSGSAAETAQAAIAAVDAFSVVEKSRAFHSARQWAEIEPKLEARNRGRAGGLRRASIANERDKLLYQESLKLTGLRTSGFAEQARVLLERHPEIEISPKKLAEKLSTHARAAKMKAPRKPASGDEVAANT